MVINNNEQDFPSPPHYDMPGPILDFQEMVTSHVEELRQLTDQIKIQSDTRGREETPFPQSQSQLKIMEDTGNLLVKLVDLCSNLVQHNVDVSRYLSEREVGAYQKYTSQISSTI